MNIPDDLKYTESHEWVKVEGDLVTVGITDYAQDALGDIVYVEFPEIGEEFTAGDDVLTIESVKAASSVYTPFSGKIVEVNTVLEDSPQEINTAPYEAYLFKMKVDDPSEIEALLDSESYQAVLATDEKE